MTDGTELDERPRRARKPRARRVRAVVALAGLLVGSGCQRGPGPAAPSPEPQGSDEVRRGSAAECRAAGRILGLEGLAEELRSDTPDPRDLATSYAARHPSPLRRAAFEGCLEGVRAVFELELEASRLAPLAEQAAERAGCTPIATLPDEGPQHVPPGSTVTWRTKPAASGAHSPDPLPPDVRVYERPVEELRAVHNLEHAYVLIYYRAERPALSAPVVEALAEVAGSLDKVVLAPYRGLPRDTGVALVAWTRLQRCPLRIGAEDAELIARSFALLFAGTDVAPEPQGP